MCFKDIWSIKLSQRLWIFCDIFWIFLIDSMDYTCLVYNNTIAYRPTSHRATKSPLRNSWKSRGFSSFSCCPTSIIYSVQPPPNKLYTLVLKLDTTPTHVQLDQLEYLTQALIIVVTIILVRILRPNTNIDFCSHNVQSLQSPKMHRFNCITNLSTHLSFRTACCNFQILLNYCTTFKKICCNLLLKKLHSSVFHYIYYLILDISTISCNTGTSLCSEADHCNVPSLYNQLSSNKLRVQQQTISGVVNAAFEVTGLRKLLLTFW